MGKTAYNAYKRIMEIITKLIQMHSERGEKYSCGVDVKKYLNGLDDVQ